MRVTAGILGRAVLVSLIGTATARADFKVWRPDVNLGELALENLGDAGFDPNPDKNGEQSYTFEVEYGVTRWWMTELELELEREAGPDLGTRLTQVTSENLFQFTERGQYWVDVGFFAEYGQALLKGSPNEVTFGPIFRKDFWGLSNTINLFMEKDLGRFSSGRPQYQWAWETRVDAWLVKFGDRFLVEPGFQYY